MTSESPGPRRPPPRPPKSQYLLNKEVEALAAKQTAFRLSSASYPKGKNPFGESSDEESDTCDTNSSPLTKTGTNPFADCESDDEETNSRSEDKLAACEAKETKDPINLDEANRVASSNPFDVLIDQQEGIAKVESYDSSPSPPNVERRTNKDQFIPKHPRKRLAPKPPGSQSNSMEALATDTAASNPCMLPSSALCLSLQGMNEVAMSSSPATYRKNSTSCENVRIKGPAPPLPVGEKREIRAEGFVKYPKLRREIEDANARLSQYDSKIKVFEAKLNSARDDQVKCKKYTKKLAKLMEKRQSLANKQKELSNRLQEQALEDRHADLEYELRTILAKQEHLRTRQEQERADELLQLLLEIVQERDKLVEEQTSLDRNQRSMILPEFPLKGFSEPSADVIRSG